MPISLSMEGRAEVNTNIGDRGGVVDVALRAGVKILTDWGMRLSRSPPIVA